MMEWAKIILIPIFLYLPAYGLVYMAVEGTRNSLSSQVSSLSNQVSSLSNQVNSLGNRMETFQTSSKNTATQQKAEEEKLRRDVSINALRSDIESMKATLKGDLFKDMSLPVLTAIASIFAAFAVKDILTEILKNEEKAELIKKIQEDAEALNKEFQSNIANEQKELTNNISHKAEELAQEITDQRRQVEDVVYKRVSGEIDSKLDSELKAIKNELRWLEYSFASVENELLTIQNISFSNPKDFEQIVEQGKLGVISALENLKSQNSERAFDLLSKYECAFLAHIVSKYAPLKDDIAFQRKILFDDAGNSLNYEGDSDNWVGHYNSIKATRLKLMIFELESRKVIEADDRERLLKLVYDFDSKINKEIKQRESSDRGEEKLLSQSDKEKFGSL